MDLESIVLKYQKTKDDKYFNILYSNTIKIVKFVLYTYTQDKNTIEDLSQDVYMKLVKVLDNYKENNIINFIYQIAKTTGLDYVRKVHELTDIDLTYIPSSSKNPYLNYALSHLDNDLKEIFLMKVLLGYTTKKISLILNISIKIVNSKYYKAKEILAKELEGIDDEIK